MIGGLGFQELLVILLIVLIIFGAGKLPSVGANLGKAIKNFKSSVSGKEEVEGQAQASQTIEQQGPGQPGQPGGPDKPQA